MKNFGFRVGRYLRCFREIICHGLPEVAVGFDAGIGDELYCSCLCHELKKRGQKKLWMLTYRPELFLHSPDVDHVASGDFAQISLMSRLGVEMKYPGYASPTDPPPREHVLKTLLRQAGVRGEVALRPYIYFKDGEEKEEIVPAAGHELICVQSSGLAARYPVELKEWYPERFQRVVDGLKDKFTVVQVGSAGDPRLEGAVDTRGKLNLRQLAVLLRQARLFVGLEGGIMHMARAVSRRSVIVYGGRLTPWQTGYTCNENVLRTLECSPCWLWFYSHCKHDHMCMADIQPPEVLQAIDRALQRHDEPLEAERVTL